jgi:hypothetical protein
MGIISSEVKAIGGPNQTPVQKLQNTYASNKKLFQGLGKVVVMIALLKGAAEYAQSD